ncbi:MAG: NB-ARC domain-containing protein, partial [Chloroflexota bacterium]
VHIRWRKATALIAYLALHPHAHNRTVLADLLWPDLSGSRANLRRLLYNMKSSGVDGWLLTDEATVCMNPNIDIRVDAVELETLMKSDSTPDETQLRYATSLYIDEFMCGFILDDARAFNDWIQHRRQLFHRYHIDALEALARLAHEDGRLAEATEYANRIIEIDPLVEPVHRMLMRLYVQMKQRDRAISQYHQLVKFMRDELGLTPQAATRKLYEDLLHAEVRPEDTAPLINVRENVAVSLLPPMPQHLIGRDEPYNQLRGYVLDVDSATVAVVGMPGIGKTALVSRMVHEVDVMDTFVDGVFWVSLGEQPDIRKQLEIWCGTLGIMPESTLETTTMKIRATVANKRMLIVVDDVWTEANLQPFMVSGSNSRIVITTRFPGVARHATRHNGCSIHLSPLSITDTRTLVNLYAPDALEDYPEEMQTLLYQLQGVPLALVLLGELLHSEYEIGMADMFLEENRDVATLLQNVPGVDGLASVMDRKRSIIERLAVAIGRSPTPQVSQYIHELAPLIVKDGVIAFHDLIDLWDRDTARQRVHELTDSGVLVPEGGGQFTSHRLWSLLASPA